MTVHPASTTLQRHLQDVEGLKTQVKDLCLQLCDKLELPKVSFAATGSFSDVELLAKALILYPINNRRPSSSLSDCESACSDLMQRAALINSSQLVQAALNIQQKVASSSPKNTSTINRAREEMISSSAKIAAREGNKDALLSFLVPKVLVSTEDLDAVVEICTSSSHFSLLEELTKYPFFKNHHLHLAFDEAVEKNKSLSFGGALKTGAKNGSLAFVELLFHKAKFRPSDLADAIYLAFQNNHATVTDFFFSWMSEMQCLEVLPLLIPLSIQNQDLSFFTTIYPFMQKNHIKQALEQATHLNCLPIAAFLASAVELSEQKIASLAKKANDGRNNQTRNYFVQKMLERPVKQHVDSKDPVNFSTTWLLNSAVSCGELSSLQTYARQTPFRPRVANDLFVLASEHARVPIMEYLLFNFPITQRSLEKALLISAKLGKDQVAAIVFSKAVFKGRLIKQVLQVASENKRSSYVENLVNKGFVKKEEADKALQSAQL